jgi:hypothetical protein
MYLNLLQTVFPGAYRVVRTTHHESQLIGDTPARDWILFEVSKPIPRWPVGTQWGLPTVAPNGLNTQEGDTAQRPPPEEGILDKFEGSTGVPSWAIVLGGAVVVGALVYAVAK